MVKNHSAKKNSQAETKYSELLAVVSYDRGFHFFTAIGHYTGETAASLVNFAAELQHIEVDSVNFHFRRHDFQNWIREVIGDKELAERIGQIETELSGEDLRKELVKIAQTRITELKKKTKIF